MRCTQVRRLLDWFADGELDPQQEAAVRAHLESCEACCEQLGLIHTGVRLTQSLPEDAPPAGLRWAILSQTVGRSKGPARIGWASWPARVAVGVSLAGAAAAVVFTIVLPGLRSPAPVATAPPGTEAAAVSVEPGPEEGVGTHEIATESVPSAEPIRVVPVQTASTRGTVGRPTAPDAVAADPGAEREPRPEEADAALEETEWPDGANEPLSDEGPLGPEVPIIDDPADDMLIGEAARIAMERSIEADLMDDRSEAESPEAVVASRFDAEELTADLLRQINERLASSKPKGPAKKIRFGPNHRGEVGVALMRGKF